MSSPTAGEIADTGAIQLANLPEFLLHEDCLDTDALDTHLPELGSAESCSLSLDANKRQYYAEDVCSCSAVFTGIVRYSVQLRHGEDNQAGERGCEESNLAVTYDGGDVGRWKLGDDGKNGEEVGDEDWLGDDCVRRCPSPLWDTCTVVKRYHI